MWRCLNTGNRSRQLLTVLFLAVALAGQGQSLIGLTKNQVEEIVRREYREFRKDDMVVRQQFNYLKYVDRRGNMTWILHFTDEDVCRISRLVCDYSEYDRKLEELSAAYRKTGESEWEYTLRGDTVQVELIREEWYFTIREAWKQRNF